MSAMHFYLMTHTQTAKKYVYKYYNSIYVKLIKQWEFLGNM